MIAYLLALNLFKMLQKSFSTFIRTIDTLVGDVANDIRMIRMSHTSKPIRKRVVIRISMQQANKPTN